MRINPKKNITTWGALAPGATWPNPKTVSYAELYAMRFRALASIRALASRNIIIQNMGTPTRFTLSIKSFRQVGKSKTFTTKTIRKPRWVE